MSSISPGEVVGEGEVRPPRTQAPCRARSLSVLHRTDVALAAHRRCIAKLAGDRSDRARDAAPAVRGKVAPHATADARQGRPERSCTAELGLTADLLPALVVEI